MMKKFRGGAAALLAFAAVTALSAPAMAQTVYSNDFNAENGGATLFNYTGFTGLTVTSGTVDIIKSGDYGITCKGGTGSCVDLDGTTNSAGVLTSGTFNYSAFSQVALGLSVSGSQRQGFGTDGIQFGFNFTAPTSAAYTFSSSSGALFGGAFTDQTSYQIYGTGFPFDYPFDDLVFTITPTTGGSLSFYINGASPDPADSNNDNIGMILDDVSLSVTPAVPEPATWAMMLAGFGAMGFAMRRRRTNVAYA